MLRSGPGLFLSVTWDYGATWFPVRSPLELLPAAAPPQVLWADRTPVPAHSPRAGPGAVNGRDWGKGATLRSPSWVMLAGWAGGRRELVGVIRAGAMI